LLEGNKIRDGVHSCDFLVICFIQVNKGFSMTSPIKKFRSLIAAAISLSILPAASAQGLFSFDPADGGAYISGYGGINFGRDAEFVGEQNPAAGVPGAAGAPAVADVDFGSGRAFGGALGYRLPFRYWSIFQPRLEIEAGTLRQGVDGGSFNGGNQIFGGNQSSTTILINNYSDLIFSENQVITPYIGGGIGVAFVDSNVVYNPPALTAPNFAVTGDDTVFVGTIAAGLSVRVNDNFDLYTEGRYTRTGNLDLQRTFIAGGANGFSANVEDRLTSLSILGGVRWHF